MSRLFRNNSPGALTRDQAVTLMKERMATRAGGGGSRDVSNEPRVPKGSGDESGEWTTGGASGESKKPFRVPEDAKGLAVFLTYSDGKREVRSGGTRAWRNNNPGNIEASSAAESMGAIGSDGRFAVFPDEATGEAALEAELNGPHYSSLTIDQAVAKRTPSKDKGNNTERTQQQVRQFSGLPGDAIIQHLSPEEKQRLYTAIKRSEGWQPGTVTRDTPNQNAPTS